MGRLQEFKNSKLEEKTTNINIKLDQLFLDEEEREKNKYLEVIKNHIARSKENKD